MHAGPSQHSPGHSMSRRHNLHGKQKIVRVKYNVYTGVYERINDCSNLRVLFVFQLTIFSMFTAKEIFVCKTNNDVHSEEAQIYSKRMF